VLIERAAIAKYLIEKYDTAGRFKINQGDADNDIIREEELMSFGGSSLGGALTLKMIFQFLQSGSPFFIRPVFAVIAAGLNKGFLNKELDSMLNYLDGGLEGKEFFLNTKNPTRVDFCTLWYIELATGLGIDISGSYPNLKNWFDRCKSRQGWKRALEKGNGYDLGKLQG
jgi:glutathione S-transferase